MSRLKFKLPELKGVMEFDGEAGTKNVMVFELYHASLEMTHAQRNAWEDVIGEASISFTGKHKDCTIHEKTTLLEWLQSNESTISSALQREKRDLEIREQKLIDEQWVWKKWENSLRAKAKKGIVLTRSRVKQDEIMTFCTSRCQPAKAVVRKVSLKKSISVKRGE